MADLKELNGLEVEYIARILKINNYQKRIKGNFPKFTKIWQVEKLEKAQMEWLENIAISNNISIEHLELKYPVSKVDSSIVLPNNCWLIVHSGSEEELLDLYEYARDIANLENTRPNYVVIGQITRPSFLPKNIEYYSIYPVTSLLEKATRVISGAGFNIIKQMKNNRNKHIVIPFERALDNQSLRLELNFI